MSELLSALRAYMARFRGEAGYVLKPGQAGVKRWHAEPHDLLHTPHDNPPELYRERELPKLADKPSGANDGWLTRIAGMDHYVKLPYGRNVEEGKDEAGRELAAYTVLGSLGFRVPHTSVMIDSRGCPGVVSRRLGEGGLEMTHPYDLTDAEFRKFDWCGTHPGDRAGPQALAGPLVLDHDRHSGNVMQDEHGRRWDLDFGTSESERWLHGLNVEDAQVIQGRLDNILRAVSERPSKGVFHNSLARLADPAAERHFDWLKFTDLRPYKAVGFDDPHGAVLDSLRVLRPDLHQLLKKYG